MVGAVRYTFLVAREAMYSSTKTGKSRGSSSVDCRNPDYTGRPSTPTSTDSESTPPNPKNPVRNRVDSRVDPDSPPSRGSSMNMLRQNSITMQVWSFHTWGCRPQDCQKKRRMLTPPRPIYKSRLPGTLRLTLYSAVSGSHASYFGLYQSI